MFSRHILTSGYLEHILDIASLTCNWVSEKPLVSIKVFARRGGDSEKHRNPDMRGWWREDLRHLTREVRSMFGKGELMYLEDIWGKDKKREELLTNNWDSTFCTWNSWEEEEEVVPGPFPLAPIDAWHNHVVGRATEAGKLDQNNEPKQIHQIHQLASFAHSRQQQSRTSQLML